MGLTFGDVCAKLSNDRCTEKIVVFGQTVQCDRRKRHPGFPCRIRVFQDPQRMEITWWKVTI